MSVSVQSRTGDEQHIMEQLQSTVSSKMRVAMPGIIQSFDPDTVTAVVQPAIKGALLQIVGGDKLIIPFC